MTNDRVCFDCGRKAECQDHHVVPKSKGGRKTVPLCAVCHGKVHDLDGYKRMNHAALTRAGIARSRAAGKSVPGRPVKASTTTPGAADQYDDQDDFACVMTMRQRGLSLGQTAELLNAAGRTTRTGRPWAAASVTRVERAARADGWDDIVAVWPEHARP